LFKYSTTTGSAGNTTAQGNPNNALGKYISTTQWTGGTLNDLFDDITGDENANSIVDYRCIFLHNNHGSLTLLSPKLWIASEVSGGANIALGVDTTAASVIGASSAQGLTIADETTAPSGVSFSSPTTKSAGLSLGDIPAGQCKAFWFRRTATNSAALNNDGVTVQIEGDTSA
jgi:hypothetical protein